MVRTPLYTRVEVLYWQTLHFWIRKEILSPYTWSCRYSEDTTTTTNKKLIGTNFSLVNTWRPIGPLSISSDLSLETYIVGCSCRYVGVCTVFWSLMDTYLFLRCLDISIWSSGTGFGNVSYSPLGIFLFLLFLSVPSFNLYFIGFFLFSGRIHIFLETL